MGNSDHGTTYTFTAFQSGGGTWIQVGHTRPSTDAASPYLHESWVISWVLIRISTYQLISENS